MIPKITTDCIVAVCDKAMSGDYSDFIKESKQMFEDEQPELFDKLRIMVPSSISGTQKVCKEYDFDLDSFQTGMMIESCVWSTLGILWKATKATVESEDMK